jgi:transposase
MQDTISEKQILGIDVSKKTLDICRYFGCQYEHATIQNELASIEEYLSCHKPSGTIIAMENTGRYNWALYSVLAESDFEVYVLNPVHLNKSLGLVRGKDDKVDALRIAQYTSRYLDQLQRWQAESPAVQELKLLLSERKQLVETKKRISTRLNEAELIALEDYRESFQRRSKRALDEIKRDIEEVEKEISQLINQDDQLSNVAKWICSVPGVGKVLCWNLIAKTNAFKSINDPRKLACYAGVAPFNHQSGKSVRKRPAVSNFADKQLKTLLHMGALSAIKHDLELKNYYERKVQEGKNKMSVINALRNKLLQRICAVVRDEKIYQPNLVLS